ncbi:protein of unknown function [Cupriavidus taiwanensis]|nr:hypothetical protein CBM2595_A30678 [Cupriavidus taiwanensis]SOZ04855.1 hypothetical protein CBM2597_A50807 [Cupriavidus taiwanensis]SPD39129.1 protein of unknown function [Cupriavidus taiwanensis]
MPRTRARADGDGAARSQPAAVALSARAVRRPAAAHRRDPRARGRRAAAADGRALWRGRPDQPREHPERIPADAAPARQDRDHGLARYRRGHQAGRQGGRVPPRQAGAVRPPRRAAGAPGRRVRAGLRRPRQHAQAPAAGARRRRRHHAAELPPGHAAGRGAGRDGRRRRAPPAGGGRRAGGAGLRHPPRRALGPGPVRQRDAPVRRHRGVRRAPAHRAVAHVPAQHQLAAGDGRRRRLPGRGHAGIDCRLPEFGPLARPGRHAGGTRRAAARGRLTGQPDAARHDAAGALC